MCGRYTLKTPVEQLSEKSQFPAIIPLKPRYHSRPSQPAAVVRLRPGGTHRTLPLLPTDPNDLLAPIHNRMPVILDSKDYGQWLDPGLQEADGVKPLLRPYPPEAMTYFSVNLRVNNPRNDDVLCIEPLPENHTPHG